MSDIKIQWHPGFVAAMDLELAENRADLIYEKEYNLNTKPLEIDLLVIKKDKDVRTANEIGWIFRGYNVLALSGKMKKQDIKELLEKIGAIKLTFDRELADSVLEVTIKANRQTVEELRGDGSMCQALLEIMEPEINQIQESVKEDTKKNAILCAVKSFRDFGVSDDQIKGALIKNYQLTSTEADAYL